MKKGVQYSHYCGTELMEIINGIHLCMDLIESDKAEGVKWGNYAKEMTERLRDKIAELDQINEMQY